MDLAVFLAVFLADPAVDHAEDVDPAAAPMSVVRVTHVDLVAAVTVDILAARSSNKFDL